MNWNVGRKWPLFGLHDSEIAAHRGSLVRIITFPRYVMQHRNLCLFFGYLAPELLLMRVIGDGVKMNVRGM